MRSARKRMLASNRAEVGSILLASTFAGAGEFIAGASSRAAMGRRIGLITVYQRGATAQRKPPGIMRTRCKAGAGNRRHAVNLFHRQGLPGIGCVGSIFSMFKPRSRHATMIPLVGGAQYLGNAKPVA